MQTSDFDYTLPPELIAQTPVEPRDSSRLMVLHRDSKQIEHRTFRDIGDYFAAGDLLVANNSRVIPARLFGHKHTGGKVELLLLSQVDELSWKALVRGKRMRIGSEIVLVDVSAESTHLTATITEQLADAQRIVQFSEPIAPHLANIGHTPLPPYIHQQVNDAERYQTIYSRPEGSAAAPTAGLHFTPELLLNLRENGVSLETVTLHVGLDTFKPVSAETITEHQIHQEWIEVGVDSAERINQTKLAGKKIIAVGTTSVRTLETAAWKAVGITDSLQTVSSLTSAPACPWKPIIAYSGQSDLFIYPGYQYRIVDAMLTNFHLPQSSLLMLVSAFSDQQFIRHAYDEAIREKYRFFSFGDAMLIL